MIVTIITTIITIIMIIKLNSIFVDKSQSTVRLTGKKAAETKQEIYRILYRYRFRKTPANPQHIKATKGTTAYLTIMGSREDVIFPQHWKREDCTGSPRCSRVPLPQQSKLYQQIVKLVQDTWDGTKVGVGFDGVGLSHSTIIIRQIYACKHVASYRQYDTVRKNLCMDASVNTYLPVQGLKGEQGIATQLHITGNNLQYKILAIF